jgi:hypothetical protein
MCNHDCFNCQYEDCIEDDLTLDDFKFSKALDRYNSESNFKKEKLRKKSTEYNSRNRSKNRDYAKRYYQNNTEKVVRNVRAWQKENREYWNTYMRSRAKGRDDLWSQADMDYLTKKWGRVQIATLKRRLKRSKGAILIKARRLGLMRERQAG